ncbi:Flap endonuclease GEN-like [Actinidia chinensis var. chinensis]|uniref:Single-strand DNA endonuclease 1 n=1 Tax=Actinidia chinensis var. chinensis TaxID=1590841 RepID=A0A2R6RST5_ACTCC|nr:Flap endonuclease GEN-like [Actinidia chinensis var. chinensis]
MGVKNLWDILESCKKTLPLHHLQNKRVCIDLSCWMVQLHSVNKSHCSLKDKLYLKGLFHRLRALIALNCSLIFVTDGSIPAIKLSTYRRRLKTGTEATQDERDSHKVSSLRRNMGSEFSRIVKEAKLLGAALGIPCLNGVEEAEAQCAVLNSESLCDGCFSSDSDIFLFGARTVFRDICLGEGGYVVCYEMADIERKLGFGRNSLITLAILLGSDYSSGVRGFGPESACRIVKSVGDSTVLQQIALEGLSFAKNIKGSRKQGHIIRCSYKDNGSDREMNINGTEHDLHGEEQFLQVIDAYLKPKCHSADSEAVHRVLALHPFQRNKLQQICAQFFEWPPEKTDEYILPKIAERDLRRFANLLSTSSELGVHLPLDQMPVKCPVSGIIKQRKVHGQEYFEVYWEEVHGLNSSVVPADLIKSACPEKILEFEERRGHGKKPNHRKPRLKKSENRAIDLKLQNLLLDIELQSSTSQKASLSMEATLMNINGVTQIDRMNQNLLPSAEPVGNIEKNPTSDCYTINPSVAAMEVIDLLSPSPPARSRMVSKCQQANVECIEMIELSESETEASPEHTRKVECIEMSELRESETEASPEHTRKARELRSFLASIREDLSK